MTTKVRVLRGILKQSIEQQAGMLRVQWGSQLVHAMYTAM
jgi:hypothetical protein